MVSNPVCGSKNSLTVSGTRALSMAPSAAIAMATTTSILRLVFSFVIFNPLALSFATAIRTVDGGARPIVSMGNARSDISRHLARALIRCCERDQGGYYARSSTSDLLYAESILAR